MWRGEPKLALPALGGELRFRRARGKGIDEVGIESGTDRVLVEIDPRYFRPTEVEQLLGDPTKARQKLGWRHRVSFQALVDEMVDADLATVRSELSRSD